MSDRKRLAIIITVIAIVITIIVVIGRTRHPNDTQATPTPTAATTTPASATPQATVTAPATPTATPTATQANTASMENTARAWYEARHSWGANADTTPDTLTGHPYTDIAAAYTTGSQPATPSQLTDATRSWDMTPPEDNTDPTIATYGENTWQYITDIDTIIGFHAHATDTQCDTTGHCTVTGTVNWILWSQPMSSGYQTAQLGYDGQSHDDVWAWCPEWGTLTVTDTLTVNTDGTVSAGNTDNSWWLADPYYQTPDDDPNATPSGATISHEAIPVYGAKPKVKPGAYVWQADRVGDTGTDVSRLWYGGNGVQYTVGLTSSSA